MPRLWRDFNGDGVVQGDPLNVFPNGELLTPGDPNFGQPVQTIFVDPEWGVGWGNRGANWEYSASVEHELRPNVSVNAGYFYRTFVNFSVRDDLNLGPEAFTQYTLFIPEGPQFPNGGEYAIPGFTDQNPNTLGRPEEVETTGANTFGGRSETWRGFDLTADARLQDLTLRGGLSTGSTSFDRCALAAGVPETVDGQFCETSTNWLTQVQLLGSYSFPYDIQVAGTLRSMPGREREAQWAFDSSATDLGRPFVGGTGRENILEPGPDYGDRVNIVDLRLSKVFSVGRQTRVRAMVDLYNAFNSNAVVAEDERVESFLTPLGIVQGRLAKFAVQLDF